MIESKCIVTLKSDYKINANMIDVGAKYIIWIIKWYRWRTCN